MPFSIDESCWPVAVLTIVGQVTRDEELAIARGSSALALRGERHVLIVDLLRAATPTPQFVRTQAAAQREHYDAIAKTCAGVVFAINSPMLRGALKAILYIQDLPCPQTVVKTLEEAKAWASRALQ